MFWEYEFGWLLACMIGQFSNLLNWEDVYLGQVFALQVDWQCNKSNEAMDLLSIQGGGDLALEGYKEN